MATLRLERAILRGRNISPLCRELFGPDEGAVMERVIAVNAFGEWNPMQLPGTATNSRKDQENGTH
jgi:hypothetical protein